ncbi:hypothetical protein G6L35_23650 [Agrobacterium tumefaciens]|nr:hypothetical protein [Agrobacterium tumefaciens]NSZ71623.1 hypothetical protein [Agrobacterium tumefaciens]
MPRLRDFRAEKIDMDCRRCDHYGVYERKALVRKLGASIEFVELKHKLAMGCERRLEGKCEARFPCLLKIGLFVERS